MGGRRGCAKAVAVGSIASMEIIGARKKHDLRLVLAYVIRVRGAAIASSPDKNGFLMMSDPSPHRLAL